MTETERLKELQTALFEAEAATAKARNLLLEDAVLKEFGQLQLITREEFIGVGQKTPAIAKLDDALRMIVDEQRKVGNRLYKLEHPDTNPPF